MGRIPSSTSGDWLTLHRFIRPLWPLPTTSCDGSDPAAVKLLVVVSGCCEWSECWQSPSVQTEADARAAGPGLRRTRRLWRRWQAEAEAAIYPPSWPVASMAALIKVNGLRSGGADKPGFGPSDFGPRPDFLAAETPINERHLGFQMSWAWNLQPHRSLALATKRVTFSIQSWGGFWVLEAASFSSEGKQPQPRQKLGTSTKAANVMSTSTKTQY